MTPEDVAARKAAAAQAAEAAVAHALLLSTLPVWFAPGETGSCSAALQAAAELLPMPAYGLSLDVESPELQAVDSLQALAALCVQQLLSVQQAGPYVLVGCGVFSCMLAAAMSSVLEHQTQQQQKAVLVLLDGPPAPPRSYGLLDPVAQGLYTVLRDAGRLPAVAAAAGGGSYVPVSFAGLAAELSARVQAELAAAAGEAAMPAAAGAEAMLLAPVADNRVDALEATVLQLASGLLDAGADAEAAVQRMLAVCRLVRRLCGAYAPEFVYNAPAVLLLTEDAPGQAFLEVARESCGGELSLVPLTGLVHGQVLTGAAEQQTVVVALVEGLMEMLQQV
jgi:thioesterase domain-containing protein